MTKVTILNGTYCNNPVSGTFILVKEWKPGTTRGGFVTVLDTDGQYTQKGKSFRVRCKKEDIEYDSPVATEEQVTSYRESDEQIISRIEKTFNFIPTLTAAAQNGQIRALIISGPGGVGKSYGVESQLQKMNFANTIAGKPERFELITGGCSAIGLYKTLYMNRNHGDVVVFDDCDSILWDENCLNLLKGALDTKDKRKLSWLTESRVLEKEDIPNDFYFGGSVIFLTNLKFDNVRSQKIQAHLGAIMSRAHYLDLSLDSRREQILRIKQVVSAGMLDNHRLTEEQKSGVVDWVLENQDYLHELSLRTVVKAADLAVSHEDQWQDIAEFTLLSLSGRIKKNKLSVVEPA
jgi:hypothetical protein